MTAFPRIILAGLSGGSGKTFVSAGLARALSRQGLCVMPFKKGPDYIDASWLSHAARATACNLDPFLLTPEVISALFQEKAASADISIIEGNRGLFDGKDFAGTCSTAELARQLCAPVILVLDATTMTRTAAAIVAGCRAFEPGLNLAGVILNRTAGERHRGILKDCIEGLAHVPVLGALPKSAQNPIPERHMG
ncbi:MAG: AAA family ATPase, partial [Humidesulfovibrio sp.]|nr:AAA family ATPase [Humidesulfovibrio sp.]